MVVSGLERAWIALLHHLYLPQSNNLPAFQLVISSVKQVRPDSVQVSPIALAEVWLNADCSWVSRAFVMFVVPCCNFVVCACKAGPTINVGVVRQDRAGLESGRWSQTATNSGGTGVVVYRR